MKTFILSILLSFVLTGTINAQTKKTLAVLELNAEGISESEVRIISDRIRALLFDTGYFNVIEREKMNNVLQEQGFQQSGCVSDECAVEIGQLIGVQLMVAGSIGKIGNLFTISTRIIDVQSGRVIKTAYDDCSCPIEDVLRNSTSKIVQTLTGKKVEVEPIEREESISGDTKSGNSKFYITPMIGYGFTDITEIGFGGKIGFQAEGGFTIGILYIYHDGISEWDGNTDYYGESYYAVAEFGYTFENQIARFTPSLLLGGGESSYEEWYNDDSGDYYEYAAGFGFGFNVSVDFKLAKHFALGLSGAGVFIADADVPFIFAPYATVGFIF